VVVYINFSGQVHQISIPESNMFLCIIFLDRDLDYLFRIINFPICLLYLFHVVVFFSFLLR
jgi:hypothetical protein